MNANAKLAELIAIEGFDDFMDFWQEIVTDSVCAGICMNPDCDYSTEVEPDQDAGWCEVCQMQTVKSGLLLCEDIGA